ncbi:MAG: hypothetical protein ACO3JL_21330, partial [Myxococcota bacterium]
MDAAFLPKLAPADLPGARDVLDAAGCAWWEASFSDEHHNGVLVGWGFGHPGARGWHERAVPARVVPSLLLVVWAKGRTAFWLHQRYDEEAAAWQEPAGRWRFGKSQVETLRDLKAQVVIARIDCALPGTRHRLIGHVEMGGVPRRSGGARDYADELWSPLMGPGQGRAILTVGEDIHFHLQGDAQHHRYARSQPWARQGIVIAGYASLPDRTYSYQVRRHPDGRLCATGVVIDEAGHSSPSHLLDVELDGSEALWEGMTLRAGADPWLHVESIATSTNGADGTAFLSRNRAPMPL